MSRAFFDSNLVVYAFSDDPRAAAAERLLAEGGHISVQVLNEFVNVARRKLGFDWAEIDVALDAIRKLVRAVHPIDLETHARALTLAQRYGFAFYDALIVSSALKAKCDMLYSEDMQDGLEVEGSLRITNPFR
jgi:predicted nucleic acid-binding protein